MRAQERVIELEPTVVQISFSELPTLQKHLYYSSAELRCRGVDVWTVGSSNVGIDVELSERNMLVNTPPNPRPSAASIIRAFATLRDVAERLREFDPHIVHFVSKHSWNYLLLLLLRRVIPSAKILHTFHDPIGHQGDSVQKGVILYNRVIQRSLDGIVVLSDVAYRQTKEALRPSCPVYQVPFGEKPWRDYSPILKFRHRVLVFGRLNSYKGVRFYPEIAERLLVASPGTTLVIAGRPANDIDSEILERLSALPNVELHARYIDESEIDAFFDSCDFVLLPYTSITQSGVVLDAYSRSRCVIAFDIDGIRQFVFEDRVIVPSFDVQEFVERISTLESDLAVLNCVTRSAWEKGKDRFSLDASADALLRLYREIAK